MDRIVNPNAVYTAVEAARLLSLPLSCIAREHRLGRLRVSRRGKRNFILGAWLLQWLEAGEVRRGAAPHAA